MTPLIRLVDPDALDPDTRALFDHAARTRGMVANVFKALANSPKSLERVAALGEFLRFDSTLPPLVREAAILTVARELGCAYEWAHHSRIARELGMAPEFLDALRGRAAEDEDAPMGPALRVARTVTRAEVTTEADIDQLREALGDEGLVELLVLVGYYSLLAGVLTTLRVPLEDGQAPRGFDA